MALLGKILLLLAVNFTAFAVVEEKPIEIEVKKLSNDIVFVFYHSPKQMIDWKVGGKIVQGSSNIPVNYSIVNKGMFNQYAKNFAVSKAGQIVSFVVDKELSYQSLIHGEKLYALRFRGPETEKDKSKDEKKKIVENNAASITYKKHANGYNINLAVGNDNSNIAAFVNNGYLWIVSDQNKSFAFEKKDIFSNLAFVPSQGGTVLKMPLPSGVSNVDVIRSEKGWTIKLSSSATNTASKDLNVKSISDGFVIKGNFANKKTIIFEDPNIGSTVVVVPMSDGSRLPKQVDELDFSILESSAGLVINVIGDDVRVKKYHDGIKILASEQDVETVSDNIRIFEGDISDVENAASTLPYFDNNLNILNFNEQKATLIREAAAAKDGTDAFNKNLALARFFFVHQWYQEAISALNAANHYSHSDYQINLQARMMMAVSYTMIGEHGIAKDLYKSLLAYDNIRAIPEVVVWDKYNDFALGVSLDSIGLDSILQQVVPIYPEEQYWNLLFAELELSLKSGDIKKAELIAKGQRLPKRLQDSYSLKYYKALLYKKKGMEHLTIQYYKDLASQTADLFNEARAKFELIKYYVGTKDLSFAEAIEELESLRFLWRGDQLEYQMLLQLASYYEANNDVLNAMRTYQYTQHSFSNKVSNFYITSEMARIFNNVFLPNGLADKMDDFDAIALFYEFKELNPIGEPGDNIILSIARKLVRLDLLENAEELLSHQINYRLKGFRRIVAADNLAWIFIMDNKNQEAIDILNLTDRDNVDYGEHEKRARIKAQALVNLQKYDDAIECLQGDFSLEARSVRNEALFQSKNWNGYIENNLGNIEKLTSEVDSKPMSAHDVLRFAIASYMINDVQKLELIDNLLTSSSNKMLQDSIAVLRSGSSKIDYRNLEKTIAVDQLQTALQKYKSQFLDQSGQNIQEAQDHGMKNE